MTASDWGPDSPATVERDDADSVPSVAAPGRTPAREGDRTPGERTDDLRAQIGTVIHNAACSCLGRGTGLMLRESDCHLMADAVIAAGFRLVSDDEATVDRVAKALHDRHCDAEEDGPCRRFDLHREWHIATARVAVEALRDGGVDRG